jgi:hypothetical protein
MKITFSTTEIKKPIPITEYTFDEITGSFLDLALIDDDNGERKDDGKFILEVYRITGGFKYRLHPIELVD